ncbi:MAG: hypothetical protein IT452_18045 [Planctomycetia bacterium]|nr:hypothetical protein [Planctomycetia bacterium]
MKRFLWFPLFAALLCCVVFAQRRLDSMPEKQELAATNPFGKLPPAQYMAEYVGSMLLGGMRAVAIDYLWIQYMKAEKARNYVEVNAILEILLRLQPNFAEIWQHLAWAKAYNIAAQQESEDERWLWVKSALEDSDQSIRRNPSSEKLLFHKGYMLFHRLPQEQGLVDRFRAWTGRDASEAAAHTLRDAILLAQSKGLNNTTPPADGMMQEAYARWAHELMRRGEFEAAQGALQEGHDVYIELMRGRGVSDVNAKATRLALAMKEPYRMEGELAEAAKAGRPTDSIRVRLLETYAGITKEYALAKAADERVLFLTDGPLARALRRAREGGAAEGAEEVGRTILGLYADLSVRNDGTENGFYPELVRMTQMIQAALRLEAEGRREAAVKKYDDIVDEFRYKLPGDAPQWALIQSHAAWLKER